MNAQSFSVAEDVISLRGPSESLTATTFAWTDERTLEVAFAPQTQLGLYEMELGSQIQDVGLNFLDQDGDFIPGETTGDRYRATFTLANLRNGVIWRSRIRILRSQPFNSHSYSLANTSW